MSRDPYHDFASDLEKSLSSAKSISRRYQSLRSSSSSSQALLTTKDELLDSIEGLKQDVQDVKQSVNVVEKAGPERFGVGWDELQRRKSFVDQCENDIEELNRIANSGTSDRKKDGFTSLDMDRGEDQEDPNEAFEREQQQMLMEQQDSTLNTIGSTINSLKNQAGLLGNEISEQVELITTFDQEVDQSQSRLGRARKRMDEMIKLGEERTGGWCVWLLVLVLFILLIIVFLI